VGNATWQAGVGNLQTDKDGMVSNVFLIYANGGLILGMSTNGSRWIGDLDVKGNLTVNGSSLSAIPQMQVFDTSGTFTVPANVTRIMVEMWGGGGGGGGGGYLKDTMTVNAGDSLTVTVGAGCTGGSSGVAGATGAVGSYGGTSSLLADSAPGGGGGNGGTGGAASDNSQNGQGGSGGPGGAPGGQLTIPGQFGQSGPISNWAGGYTGNGMGFGGNAGGGGGFGGNPGGDTRAGGGGSGGVGQNGNGNAGTSGGAGRVIVWW
jgi:hypothetical protein